MLVYQRVYPYIQLYNGHQWTASSKVGTFHTTLGPGAHPGQRAFFGAIGKTSESSGGHELV